jgi:hypothetical protein
VRREVDGEMRRGVTFVRELVPRRAIAAIARLAYNEPYSVARMRSTVPTTLVDQPGRVAYEWDAGGSPSTIGDTRASATAGRSSTK